MSNRAADAISPTITGRNPMNAPFIIALSLCARMKWLAYMTKMYGGITTAAVARIAPMMFPVVEYPI